MATIFTENFLLQSDIAQELYHQYAKNLPIIDYHNHLSPEMISKNQSFGTITKLWLQGDHYKWRAMRALGIEEKYITGNASDEEKFIKWAEAVPSTLRNPLFHWTHLELKNTFGIDEYLNPSSAVNIYQKTLHLLQEEQYFPQALLKSYRVEMLGTTDDPTDSLEHHTAIHTKNIGIKVKPSFRPDKVLALASGDSFRAYIQTLSEVAKVAITNLDTLLQALQNRILFFNEKGCVATDHGLETIPLQGNFSLHELDIAFTNVLSGNDQLAPQYEQAYAFYILSELCKMYHQQGWVQQFHLGALRNNNTYQLKQLGPDTGYDSIGDFPQAVALSRFLNYLENENKLSKTILYNLNPADNAIFGTMPGNFQGEGIRGKIQFGSGWWFLDQLDGMTDQLNTLSNMGLISTFIGMLTDSRSFLSFPRHEYFRRLVCNLFAEDIIKGHLPHDTEWIGKIIQDICYYNAKSYFRD
ncbi:glucuronate isomerase [Elizabethkingia sp. JS20170427COW]|uniref:glucuronate isomerase n=1 Tax=Elizabethkingia sp. JS20170427COW TaxID=2583851 RepID=UPI001110ED3E|nr:glucuronate isomerase [Elizabethkingia sp. JS20170427COW]QCX52948.1 glucuronate isomerase [Elizabethkingia sp. JS20170427COW]